MSNQQQTPPRSSGGVMENFVEVLLKILGGIVLVGIFLPIAIPLLVSGFFSHRIAKRQVFWVTPRWHVPLNIVATTATVLVLAWEVWQIVEWIASGKAAAVVGTDGWIGELAAAAVPWLVLNFVLGVVLVPIMWSIRRRRIAEQVRLRKIPNVSDQEDIEQARRRAADLVAAQKIGVKLDPATGVPRGSTAGAVTAPRDVDGRQAVGIVARDTVRTFGEVFQDRRRVGEWTDPRSRWIVLPDKAGAMRFLLVAESGSGKTVLLFGLILAALARGWRGVFIDAKGDPRDARRLVALARQLGYSAEVAGKWNMFAGTAQQITDKIMRCLPTSTGDGEFYNREVRGVLQAVQGRTPLRGMRDLLERLANPAAHVGSQDQLDSLMAVVDSRAGITRVDRVRDRLLIELDPLKPHLSATGWSFDDVPADLTVVPLSPIDAAQKRLGDLMIHDLRNFLADRLARRAEHGDDPEAISWAFVDEFAQLVSDDSDPADSATALYETSRSADFGLGLAVQGVAGLSADENKRRRALASGAALFVGRSKDPEDTVKYAGTVMHMEASGQATADELNSGRSQHTFVIPPQNVRQAALGQFWLIQSGAVAPFRALPNPPLQETPAPAPAAAEPEPAAAASIEPAPATPPDAEPAPAAEERAAAPD